MASSREDDLQTVLSLNCGSMVSITVTLCHPYRYLRYCIRSTSIIDGVEMKLMYFNAKRATCQMFSFSDDHEKETDWETHTAPSPNSSFQLEETRFDAYF